MKRYIYSYYRDPEPPIDPPDYDEPEVIPDFDEHIEIQLDNVVVVVSDDGKYVEWEDDECPWACYDPSKPMYPWPSEEYQIDLVDSDTVQLDTMEFLYPNIPDKDGRYAISCDVDLVYTVSELEMYATYWTDEDDDLVYDIDDIITDYMECTFDLSKSKIENLEITPLK